MQEMSSRLAAPPPDGVLHHAIQDSGGSGFVVSLVSVSMGVTLGALSGYLGGWWDNVIMRFNDVENSLPDLPILMVLSKIFPPGFWTMCLILVALSAFRGMRVARAMTLTLKSQLFSEAARSLGADHVMVMERHLPARLHHRDSDDQRQ
jgi:ABC-type dipeptide/oligopeptide/nickel transport system permease subunit